MSWRKRIYQEERQWRSGKVLWWMRQGKEGSLCLRTWANGRIQQQRRSQLEPSLAYLGNCTWSCRMLSMFRRSSNLFVSYKGRKGGRKETNSIGSTDEDTTCKPSDVLNLFFITSVLCKKTGREWLWCDAFSLRKKDWSTDCLETGAVECLPFPSWPYSKVHCAYVLARQTRSSLAASISCRGTNRELSWLSSSKWVNLLRKNGLDDLRKGNELTRKDVGEDARAASAMHLVTTWTRSSSCFWYPYAIRIMTAPVCLEITVRHMPLW